MLGASMLGPVRAQAPQAGANRFDGAWQMVFFCDKSPDGAAAYSHIMAATVTNGRFHSTWGIRDNPDSASFDGTIASDGSVTLTATGLTGPTIYNYGHVTAGTPFVFHMVGHFAADHGEGNRIENRPCTMNITRK